MKQNITILQAFTEQYYHTVPGELKKITLTPEREAIFKHIAQIGYTKFPEFILDILTHVDGHKSIDITDGPGDEKQDILTVTPSGERQLTQCKHTINYKNKHTGDELDLLFGACYRKNCKKGILVTNSDLTPQAKRYITDKEYARGWQGDHASLPEIDYWNSNRIWERIATNDAILNKWFSGMGQTHGLRQFSFHLIVQNLPSGDVQRIKCEEIFESLKNKVPITQIDKSNSYEIILNEELSFNISDSFHSDLDTGLNYIPVGKEQGLVNIPLWAIAIQVKVVNTVGQYNPSTYRDMVVKFLGDNVLPILTKNDWSHLIATTPKAFIFLQDIVAPKIVPVSEAESYLRVEDFPVTLEREWVFLKENDGYNRLSDGENTDLEWLHVDSEIKVALLLEQRIHPIRAYEYRMCQNQLIKKISSYNFRAVSNANQEVVDRIRRTVDPKWIVLLSSDKDLFWAFPPTEKHDKILTCDKLLQRQGIAVKIVADEDREALLEMIDIDTPHSSCGLSSDENDLTIPIRLNKRIYWLSKKVKTDNSPQSTETWIELLTFKASYENQHGFDFMQGKKKSTIASEEIQGLLFELTSIRGRRMLDIAISNEIVFVNLRIREMTMKSSASLISAYIEEMSDIIKGILDILTLQRTNKDNG